MKAILSRHATGDRQQAIKNAIQGLLAIRSTQVNSISETTPVTLPSCALRWLSAPNTFVQDLRAADFDGPRSNSTFWIVPLKLVGNTLA